MTARGILAWLARRPASILALATAAAIAAYSPSIRGPFLFDDLSEIVDNPAIRTLLPPWRPMFEGGELPHRPIPYFSFALNYQAGRLAAAAFGSSPLDPLPFHAVNLLVHLVNGWLLYWIIGTLLAGRLNASAGFSSPRLIAAVAAAVWLVHPLQSQAVSYVYQRIELLAAFSTLATAAAFLKATTAARPLPWVALATLACGLGMACKEWVVVVPPVILLLDRAFLAASWREVFARRGGWHLALFATWPIVFAVVALQRDRYPEAGFSAWQAVVYAANQPVVILWYLSRLVLPIGLSIDHGAVLRTDLLGRDTWRLLPALGTLALAGWAGVALPRRPAAAFSILAFLLLLAPASSILPVQDVCVEHRMYLAAAIPITAAVVLLAAHAPRLLPLTAAAVVALAAVTAARNTVYRSPLAAWHDAVMKSGGSSRSLARYGTELSKLDRHDEAIAACAAAVERNPLNPVPYAALSAAFLNAGRPEEAARASQAGLATQGDGSAAFRDPVLDRLRMYLGLALDRAGDPRGEPLLRDAVARMPDSLAAKEHLARAVVRSDPREAADLWASIAAEAPDDAYVIFNLGSTVARFDADAAIPILARAIALDPTNPDAHNNLGNAFLTLGQHDRAVAAYRRCLEFAPGHPQAAANLRALGRQDR
jgi:tetratricopeptide (TPR) repeat protein